MLHFKLEVRQIVVVETSSLPDLLVVGSRRARWNPIQGYLEFMAFEVFDREALPLVLDREHVKFVGVIDAVDDAVPAVKDLAKIGPTTLRKLPPLKRLVLEQGDAIEKPINPC